MPNSFELLRFQSSDPLEDAALELGALCEMPPKEAATIVQRVLDSYHFKRDVDLSDIPQVVFSIVVHITQPYRIPGMTARMDEVLDKLRSERIRSVLDYGGGGGKDCILFARCGFETAYADLLDQMTPLVRRRFAIRNLNVQVEDVRRLGGARFEAISCMDVIEHVYDVEFVVADLAARLRPGGHLLCYPAFFNSWDGDHVEKNCAYSSFFVRMVESGGLTYKAMTPPVNGYGKAIGRMLGIVELPSVLHFLKATTEAIAPVAEERLTIQQALYRSSATWSMVLALWSWVIYPFIWLAAFVPSRFGKGRLSVLAARAKDLVFSNAIDGLAVWRLSQHRLKEFRDGKTARGLPSD